MTAIAINYFDRQTVPVPIKSVIPHAWQLHDFQVVMANLNSPITEYFPDTDKEFAVTQ